MKKTIRFLMAITFAFSLTLFSTGAAQADYHNPPGWDNDPYFTHQTWNFHQIPDDYDEFDNPIFYPEVDDNPYEGLHGMIHDDFFGTAVWHDTWEGRNNVWQYDENSIVDFFVPNSPNPDLTKEVWFQATYYTIDGGQISEDSWIYPEPAESFFDVFFEQVSRDAIEGEPGWYRETWMGTIIPQPELEDFCIFFDGGLDEFGFPIAATVYVDQVDIDTRCVPIPGAIWLLGSGLLGLVGIRRRKV